MLSIFLLLSVAFATIQEPSFEKRMMKEETAGSSEQSSDSSSGKTVGSSSEPTDEEKYGPERPEYKSMKYLIGDMDEDYLALFLNKCAQINNWSRKYIPYNSKYYIEEEYKSTDCSGDNKKTYYRTIDDDVSYANRLPAHVAYSDVIEDDSCKEIDEGAIVLYPSECTKRDNIYVKYKIVENKVVEYKYSDNQCNTETSNNANNNENKRVCDACFGDRSDYEKLHCKEYPQYGPEKPEYKSKKYLIGDMDEDYLALFLNKCAQVDNWSRKYLPYNDKYYIEEEYKSTDCSGDNKKTYYRTIDDDVSYADELPAHVAYSDVIEDDSCKEIDEGAIILYPSACTRRDSIYVKYKIVNNKVVEYEYSDDKCNTEKSNDENDNKNKRVCDACFGDRSDYEKLHCKEYPVNDGTAFSFIFMAIALLFFIF